MLYINHLTNKMIDIYQLIWPDVMLYSNSSGEINNAIYQSSGEISNAIYQSSGEISIDIYQLILAR